MTTKKKFELDFKKLREDIDLEQLNNDLIGYRDQIARLREASNKSMDISKQCAESRKAEISLPPPPDYDAIGVWGHVKPASYTDESLREYGQACREAALEEAAQICSHKAETKRLFLNEAHYLECAEAIRRLI